MKEKCAECAKLEEKNTHVRFVFPDLVSVKKSYFLHEKHLDITYLT